MTESTPDSARFPRLARTRAAAGIAVSQLNHARGRTVLTILGITLAVLAATLLAGTGLGVIETGQQKFDSAGRDIWMTGGPVKFSPTGVGGFENTIVDSHQLSADLQSRDDVRVAVPMAFQTVYVKSNESDYETLVGVGAPARGGSVQITNGSGFSSTDVHYADGNYSGPMTHEVVIDQRTAEMMNVSVGDSLYIGGTTGIARQNEFTVVGISPTFSRFLGTPSVVVHLSELQEVTGTTGADKATLVTLTVEDGVNPENVATQLEEAYPNYDVRTNEEQLAELLRDQAVIMAAGGSLVFLALFAGLALTVNILLSHVYHQQREFAALKALGTSSSTLSLTLVFQALFLGTIGGLLGVALSFPAARGLNRMAELVVGFGDIVTLPMTILAGGFAIAFVMSVVSSLAVSRQIAGIEPLDHL
ncbi:MULTISPECIES: ABC transporter permease [Haloferax]|uniref:FtsX-like permease family protein n=2 Tax=Haloferax TaxID=2251 RepID=A0A6G1Z0Z5_9EURY|nr:MULTISPECIES: ABC transporter permease [Haloferax]KAB1187538.1 ABC transporter permease [Haloferax sp. CBA1149]MRW80193.1 FtsX-like permease family protein [Haloferax marinisediminis]